MSKFVDPEISDAIELKSIIKELIEHDAHLRALSDHVYHATESLNKVPQLTERYNLKPFYKACAESTRIAKLINDTLVDLNDNLDNFIKEREAQRFKASFDAYVKNINNILVDPILNKKMSISEETRLDLRVRLGIHGNWKYAGLIIRPGAEDFINHMVDCDPLYVADQSDNLLIPVISRFPREYQNRVRLVTITENLTGQPFLSSIPESQIGLCFVFYFFEFKPIEIIEQYFKEIYVKLKPGGKFVFTFNNCEKKHNVLMAEKNFYCYTPREKIFSLLKQSGFKIDYVHEVAEEPDLYWVECSKIGTWESIRGGQILLELKEKETQSPNKDIDLPSKRVYTLEQVTMLREIAAAIQVDAPQNIFSGLYSATALDRIIRRKLEIRTGTSLTSDEILNLYNQWKRKKL